jgi:hypothetical protein
MGRTSVERSRSHPWEAFRTPVPSEIGWFNEFAVVWAKLWAAQLPSRHLSSSQDVPLSLRKVKVSPLWPLRLGSGAHVCLRVLQYPPMHAGCGGSCLKSAGFAQLPTYGFMAST